MAEYNTKLQNALKKCEIDDNTTCFLPHVKLNPNYLMSDIEDSFRDYKKVAYAIAQGNTKVQWILYQEAGSPTRAICAEIHDMNITKQIKDHFIRKFIEKLDIYSENDSNNIKIQWRQTPMEPLTWEVFLQVTGFKNSICFINQHYVNKIKTLVQFVHTNFDYIYHCEKNIRVLAIFVCEWHVIATKLNMPAAYNNIIRSVVAHMYKGITGGIPITLDVIGETPNGFDFAVKKGAVYGDYGTMAAYIAVAMYNTARYIDDAFLDVVVENRDMLEPPVESDEEDELDCSNDTDPAEADTDADA